METEDQMNERIQKVRKSMDAYYNLVYGPSERFYVDSLSKYVKLNLN